MNTKYTYEKMVNVTKLTEEIEGSSIVTALDYISTIGSTDDIWFKAELSMTDKTTLDTIVANHAYSSKVYPTPVYTMDDKQWVQGTSRPFGTVTCFTSRGDATSDSTVLSTDVGTGEFLKISHHVGDGTCQNVIADLNVIENRTYVHEGYIIWSGADFDSMTVEIIPQVTEVTPGSNTYFNLYGPYILPAAGDGNVNLAGNPKLVEMPPSWDTGLRAPGYWNAPYDITTHTFGDLTACPDGSGIYNLFAAEIPMARFGNDLLAIGNGALRMQSEDVHSIGHGMRFKLIANTDGTADHEWKAGFIITLNREKTC
jgi:hypothetical protein